MTAKEEFTAIAAIEDPLTRFTKALEYMKELERLAGECRSLAGVAARGMITSDEKLSLTALANHVGLQVTTIRKYMLNAGKYGIGRAYGKAYGKASGDSPT